MKHRAAYRVTVVVSAVLAMAACGVPKPFCDTTTCSSGCCNASGECKASEFLTCGSGGNACAACQLGQSCSQGVCRGGAVGVRKSNLFLVVDRSGSMKFA